jgi:enoyl-CoA hydratase
MHNPFEPHLKLRLVDDICVVSFNHPETLNSVDEPLHKAISEVWAYLASVDGLRAVVLTGEGRAFSAGGDFVMFQELQDDHPRRSRLIDEARAIVEATLNFPLPVVAAVNGPAIGLGASLAVLSDMVFIAESAYMADPHVAVGLTAGDGGPLTWPFVTGLLRAKEYLYTGDRISAERAVELGLANRVVRDADTLAEALAYARRLAALPQHALRSTKRAINLHLLNALPGLLDYAFAMEYQSFDTPEHRQIVADFVAKSS